MRILLTGHDGYIGSVMAPLLQEAGHTVLGLDTGFYGDCGFASYRGPAIPERRLDTRRIRQEDLSGIDAVIHLAALSNDPLGDLNPELTYAINHRASVRLASMARTAGVDRFLFASSCSLYGVQGDAILDESAPFNPLTPYGESKISAEREISALADDGFSPTFLRMATVYGVSPRLRGDVVVNNLVGYAFTTGEVLIKSDGTPWRPLVHVRDACSAFLAALEAPRETVHDQAFNVGRSGENYQVRDVAELVGAAIPGSRIRYAEGAGPDPRNYRVNCSKIETVLPGYAPSWTVERGVAEVRDALGRHQIDEAQFMSWRFFRLSRIKALLQEGRLDSDLEWRELESTGEARQ